MRHSFFTGFRHPKDLFNVRTIFIALFILVLPAMAGANLWDELNEDEKKQVLTELKDRLPELIADENLKGYVQTVGDNIETWSTLAGEISAGQYDNAIQSSLKYAKDTLTEQVSNTIDEKIADYLGEDTLGVMAYEYLKTKPDSLKSVARAALSADWRKAGEIIWNEALSDAKAKIQEQSETALKNAYNWVFGNRTIGSYTPADIFLAVVAFEKEFIPYFERKTTKEKLDDLWNKYNEFLGTPPNHDAAWQAIVDFGYDFGGRRGYALWGISPDELRKLLRECDYSLYDYMKQKTDEKKGMIERQKRALENAAKEAKEETDRKLKAAYEKIRSELNALAAKAKDTDNYEAVLKEARSIVEKLRKASDAVQSACEAFDGQADNAQDALNKVTDAEAAAGRIEGYIRDAQQCEQLANDVSDIEKKLKEGEDLKSDFDRLLSDSEQLKNDVCDASKDVAGSPSKTEAKAKLTETIENARKLETAVKDTEAKAVELRNLGEQFSQSIEGLKTKVAKIDAIKRNLDTCDSEFETIDAAAGAKEDFEAAIGIMRDAKTRTDNLSQFARDILKDDSIDSADDAVRYLLSNMKSRMEKLLDPYKGIAEADQLLSETPKLVEKMSCAQRVAGLWGDEKSKTGRWGFRKWREPNIPEGLPENVRSVRQQCEKVPSDERLGTLSAQMAELVLDMEAEEVGLWIYKRDGDLCAAEAIQAYAEFEKQAEKSLKAFSTEIDKVRGICEKAQQDYSNAMQSAANVQTAGIAIETISAQIKADMAQIRTSIEACKKAGTDRSAAAQAYTQAAQWAQQARQGFDGALARVSDCASKVSVNESDELNKAAEAVAGGAARKYQQAEQIRTKLDTILDQATQAKKKGDEVKRQVDEIAVQMETINNELNSAGALRKSAEEGFRQCAEAKSQLSTKLDGLVASLESPDMTLVTDLQAQIQSLGSGSTPDFADFDGKISSAQSALDTGSKTVAEAGTASIGLSICDSIEPLSAEWMAAGEAILLLDNMDQLKARIASARQKCTDKLDEDSKPVDKCVSDADCSTGYKCDTPSGECVFAGFPGCEATGCPDDYDCDRNSGECVYREPSGCRSDDDCPPGLFCGGDGECGPPPTSDPGYSSGFLGTLSGRDNQRSQQNIDRSTVDQTSGGRDGRFTSAEVEGEIGEIAENLGCRSNSECLSGYVCISGRCKEKKKDSTKPPEETTTPATPEEATVLQTPEEEGSQQPPEEETAPQTPEEEEPQQPPEEEEETPQPPEEEEEPAPPVETATSTGIGVEVVGDAPEGQTLIVDGQLVPVENWPVKIAGMTLVLTGPVNKSTSSSGSGSFSFSLIPAGEYVISVTEWNYGMTRQAFTAPSGKAIKITLKGSCPYLYVWTGDTYTKENDIFSVARVYPSELLTDKDRLFADRDGLFLQQVSVENISRELISQKSYRDFYRINSHFAVDPDGYYRAKVREQAYERSLSDQFELWIVDHSAGIQTGVTQNGRLFQYEEILPLAATVQPNGFPLFDKEVLEVTLPAAAYGKGVLAVEWQGFQKGDGRGQSSSAGKPKLSLQRLGPEGTWRTVDYVYPRDEVQQSFFILDDLGDGWDKENTVRLVATSCHPEKFHRIDAVGWAEFLPETPTAVQLPLVSAVTSKGDDVRLKALKADGESIFLGPDDEVVLKFKPYPLAEDMERSFIFVSQGVYVPMPMILLGGAQ